MNWKMKRFIADWIDPPLIVALVFVCCYAAGAAIGFVIKWWLR